MDNEAKYIEYKTKYKWLKQIFARDNNSGS